MKKYFLSVASVVSMVFAANAVTIMNVEKKDGTVTKFDVESVNEVTFDEQTEGVAASVSGTHGLYSYVDLGLPTGTLWATCNVGALVPNQYGQLFKWGETNIAEDNRSHKYIDADGNYTKYCLYEEYGTVDGKSVLDRCDDAAVANMGGAWRMPTNNEVIELLDGCSWLWTDNYNNTGVAGVMGTSLQNKATIFFPCEDGEYLQVWSSSVRNYNTSKNMSGIFFFNRKSQSYDPVVTARNNSNHVRAVYDPKAEAAAAEEAQNALNDAKKENEELKNDLAKAQKEAEDAQKEIVTLNEKLEDCSGSSVYDLIKYNGYDHVDLGLPSGNVWSTANLGAESESTYGDYYAWGELESKPNADACTRKNYRFYDNTEGYYTKYGEYDGKTSLQLADDAIHAQMGGSWKMPSTDDFQELIDECTWEWINTEERVGALATGPNGNTIFFPAAGHWASGVGTNLYIGAFGYYWTKDLAYGSEMIVSVLRIGTDLNYGKKKPFIQQEERYHGLNIRAVCYK